MSAYIFPATVRMEVRNAPLGVQQGLHDGEFMVVRRAEEDAKLWYYGVYPDERNANEVAVEIGNGIVVQLGADDGKKA